MWMAPYWVAPGKDPTECDESYLKVFLKNKKGPLNA